MEKVVSALNNRLLIAVVMFLILLGLVRRFVR